MKLHLYPALSAYVARTSVRLRTRQQYGKVRLFQRIAVANRYGLKSALHRLLPFVTYLIASTLASAQTIRYVSTTGTNANPATATSWATSTTNLQGAIFASSSNDEVWVRAGTYRPTTTTGPASRTVSFSLRVGVKVYGGFIGTETALSQRPDQSVTAPTASTLSGDIGTVGNITDNSYHVFNTPPIQNANTLLDGFVITGGNANGSSPDNVGGGMYNDGRVNGWNGTIRNCLFVDNRANQGGAIYNNGTSGGNCSPRIINCGFLNNWGVGNTNAGGAIFNIGGTGSNASPIITNCSFLSNTATTGGAIRSTGSGTSNVTLTNCVLFGNGGVNTLAVSNTATITARYSLLENSVTNYTVGPGTLLTSTFPFQGSTDLRLPANSTGINNADPATTTATVGTSDLGLQPRFSGNLDMGAYESCVVTRLFVRANATGANTGLNWTDAFPDLQSALNYGCGQSLTEIWVAGGVYRPTPTTDRTVSFRMRPNVAIYGSFAGTETTLSQRALTFPSATTLSGDIGTVNNTADNSFHVISNPAGLTTTAVLDGFVITGGNANSISPDNVGGGMLNNGSGAGNRCSPLIRNCLFQANTAQFGGAMFNTGFSSGSSSPVLTNCLFQANTANTGGAMFNTGFSSGSSSPVLTNCSFQGNTASSGGAMYSESSFSGSSSPSLTNCVVFGNGGANTFFNSVASITARYSLFDASVTGYTSVTGNLTATTSPFASTATTRLRIGSPAIDAADPATTSATVGTTDLAGLPRFVNALDMGAFETYRFYVRATATGTNTGLSWANAFPNLQSALGYSGGGNLTEIWVAAGTYKPTATTGPASRTISFAMRPGVAIYGGFGGTETSLSQRQTIGLSTPSSSTLSGDIGMVGNITDNSFHVVRNPAGLTTTALLDGFVITGGNATGVLPDDAGGGLYNEGAGNSCSPTLSQCLFVGNEALYGGAICNDGGAGGNSSPTLTNCWFQSNTAFAQGGGLYNEGAVGGISSPLLINCSFIGNRADVTGGGLFNNGNASGSSSPTLTNCSFLNNTAIFSGGALYNNVGTSGVSSPTITNGVLWGNGGASTFFNGVNGGTATITLRYSLVEPAVTGYTSGPGNLTATTSPLASTATTRLRIGSPAIDAADPATTTATVGTLDLAGLTRFVNTLDMGALEFQNEIVSIQAGNWNVPATWNANRVPQVGDRIRLDHLVTLPTGYVGGASQVRCIPVGRLGYGIGSVLRLEL